MVLVAQHTPQERLLLLLLLLGGALAWMFVDVCSADTRCSKNSNGGEQKREAYW
jgi:hypothetical protein